MILTQAIALAKDFSSAFKTVNHLSANLQEEVKVRTRELEKAIIKIEDQSKQKRAFFINLDKKLLTLFY